MQPLQADQVAVDSFSRQRWKLPALSSPHVCIYINFYTTTTSHITAISTCITSDCDDANERAKPADTEEVSMPPSPHLGSETTSLSSHNVWSLSTCAYSWWHTAIFFSPSHSAVDTRSKERFCWLKKTKKERESVVVFTHGKSCEVLILLLIRTSLATAVYVVDGERDNSGGKLPPFISREEILHFRSVPIHGLTCCKERERKDLFFWCHGICMKMRYICSNAFARKKRRGSLEGTKVAVFDQFDKKGNTIWGIFLFFPRGHFVQNTSCRKKVQ